MNALIILLLFGSILVTVLSRPYQEEYSNDSDAEDDYKEPGAEDSMADEEESCVNGQLSASPLTGAVQNDRSGLTKFDENSFPKQRQSDRYDIANNEPQHFQQNMINREANSGDDEENEENSKFIKRTARFETSPIDEGETISQKNKDPVYRVEKNGYSIDRSRYNKKYDNTMEDEKKDMLDDQSQDSARYNQRDRRDINDNESEKPNTTSNQIVEKIDSADESAIKRHITKLSEDELNALLNSLSEDKRELLKKVISDVEINKREITKKAGAVEENNLVENSASDLSKVEIEPAIDLSTVSASSHKDSTEINKISASTDSNEKLMRKNAEITTSSSNEQEDFLNVDSKLQEEKAPIVEVASKLESKREAKSDNIDDFNIDESRMIYRDSGSDYPNDHVYLDQDENNLSKLANDDNQIYNENKACKRDTYLNNIKSLEESFPNSNSYSESESYSAPLVRVKRRNRDQNLKKRSAGVMPDAAYFPYRAENEDEDSDEGNEFDDEGFYDRTSNFGNSDKDLNALSKDNLKSPNAVDTMSLGSDTDSDISGVEGVDDNLMYSSGARNRRIAENNSNDLYAKNKIASLVDNKKKPIAENYIKAAQYQENDAFGPLPQNYEGDLSRCKRIRRVKESNSSGEQLDSDN